MKKTTDRAALIDEMMKDDNFKAIAQFMASRGSEKVYNNEGLELGDSFQITGMNPSVQEFNGNQYLQATCSGDTAGLALSNIAGTKKVRKYFCDTYFNPEEGDGLLDGYTLDDAFEFPKSETELVSTILAGEYKDKTFVLIGKCHVDNPQFSSPLCYRLYALKKLS